MTDAAGRTALRRPARGPRLPLEEVLTRLGAAGFPDAGPVVVGGGCAGLALAVALTDAGRPVAVVEARTADRDSRTWCYWDTGDALLPESVSRSWTSWEVRTSEGTARSADPAHPYRMVRAREYRTAARDHLSRSAAAVLLDGIRVDDAPAVDVASRPVFDARGAAPDGPLPGGRIRLHQRFVGQWIETVDAVFDDRVVTLMDFDGRSDSEVLFFYVLPVDPRCALVECTVFSSAARGDEPFRSEIAAYLHRRWGLGPDAYTVTGEEAGRIPMTDADTDASGLLGVPLGLRAGAARPSTGYAFSRMQREARRIAAAGPPGAARARPVRDRARTRLLDAVFLRFLRDQPHRAPQVFRLMFARLPGELTVRFLTERSSVLDDLRLVLALPKRAFLAAAWTTARERMSGRSA